MASPFDVNQWMRAPAKVASRLPAAVAIESLLAEGGQAVVYRGSVKGAAAAIKVYRPGQLQQRVQREVEALRSLSCPSVVQLLWDGVVKVGGYELPVVATALLPGTTLTEVLSRRPLSHDELSVVAYDVAVAIDDMWSRRIVHRDLKPSNVLLLPSGRACVIDLGLARHVEMTTLTAAGVTWGTYGYMSPEQTRAVRQLTCKSDVFSLGIILVEAAMGRHPTNGDQLRLFAKKLHEMLPGAAGSWQHSVLLMDMLHPRPTMRPMPAAMIRVLAGHAPKAAVGGP